MARLLTLLAVLGTTLQAYGCDNFDDLPQNPGGFNPTIDPVGTYQYIYYQGFVVATQSNSDEKFFHIPSQPNVLNSATQSQNSYGGTPAIQINTTAIDNSQATFTLSSLRLACLVTNGLSTSNANGCTILFVGNKLHRDASVYYEYEYPNQNTNATFGTGPLTNFGTVEFPNDFTGLTEVFITQTAVQNGVVGVNTLLDDVCITIYDE